MHTYMGAFYMMSVKACSQAQMQTPLYKHPGTGCSATMRFMGSCRDARGISWDSRGCDLPAMGAYFNLAVHMDTYCFGIEVLRG